MTTRILIAANDLGRVRLQKVLKGYELIEAKSIHEARQLLDDDSFAMIITSIQFDDSQSIDFLKAVRASKLHRRTPFIMFRQVPSDLAPVLRHSMEFLKGMYNIAVYIEAEFYDSHEKPDQAIREAIEQYLPKETLLLPPHHS